MHSKGVYFQLVTPHHHRTNAAKHSIQTYKDHLVAGLISCDSNLLLHFWYRLLSQATLTLNLLWTSWINPCLSAEAQLNGAFDFNRTPPAPPGTEVLLFETPAQPCTWSLHAIDGWYIECACEHYRCYRITIPKTRSEIISKTVQFPPHQCPVPQASSNDKAIAASHTHTAALNTPSIATPFLLS